MDSSSSQAEVPVENPHQESQIEHQVSREAEQDTRYVHCLLVLFFLVTSVTDFFCWHINWQTLVCSQHTLMFCMSAQHESSQQFGVTQTPSTWSMDSTHTPLVQIKPSLISIMVFWNVWQWATVESGSEIPGFAALPETWEILTAKGETLRSDWQFLTMDELHDGGSHRKRKDNDILGEAPIRHLDTDQWCWFTLTLDESAFLYHERQQAKSTNSESDRWKSGKS